MSITKQAKTITIHSRKGLTLIELLVVISIMVILVAVSVPMLKPMLQSQKQRKAAEALAAVLQTARFKAMESGDTYGIKLIKFPTAVNVSLQIRSIKAGGKIAQPPENIRVKVDNGNLTLNSPYPLIPGYRIRFGNQGRWYTLKTATTLAENITLLSESTTEYDKYVPFQVAQPSHPTIMPPDVLPRGNVVDLKHSGAYEGTRYERFEGQSVSIFFSPAGYVDSYSLDNKPEATPFGGLIYFCVGDWNRQTDPDSVVLAEDGKNNIQVEETYWVTIDPRTGRIRVTENQPSDNVNEARKFAALNE
jgi:prepilin-type N-terminal cleavage/methylation domain-containing protein